MVKTVRLVICGCASVGKTFVLKQLLRGQPQNISDYEYCHTLEDVYIYLTERDCRIYDTGGIDLDNVDETIKSFVIEHESILNISEAIILVYSVNDGGKSFHGLSPLVTAIEQASTRKEPYLYMLLGLMIDICEDEPTETSVLASKWKQHEKQIVLCREIHISDVKSLHDTFTCFINEAAIGQGVVSDAVNSINADTISFRSLRDKAGRILQSVIRKGGETTERKAADEG